MVEFPFENDLKDYKALDNTGWDYLISFVLLLIYLIIFYIIKGIFVKRLKNFDIDDVEDKRFVRVRQVGRALDEGLSLTLGIIISINFALKPLTLPSELNFILSLVFLGLIAYYIYKIINQIVVEGSEYYIEMNPESNHIILFFRLIAKAFITVAVALWYFSALGIDITVYLAGLSILAIGIAFALQNLIADFFASLVLYFDKPFKVGDSIKVGADSGKVIKIGIRSTHIRTHNGHLLVISNRELSNDRINNMSDMEQRRVVLNLGVDCNTPVAKLKKIPKWVETIVTKVDNTDFGRVHLTTLGNYSWDYQIVYHIINSDYTTYLDAQQEVNLSILAKLEKEEVNIPYPTSTVLST